MSTNTEQNKLKKVLQEFSTSIKSYQKNESKQAGELFDRLIEKHQDSEHDSVQQIITKARSYKAMVQAKLKPIKIKLESEEDFINEGIWLLNAGEYAKALEVFTKVTEKSPKNPYIYYLMSLACLKQENQDQCLVYLEKAIALDDYYRILAFNETDFESISEEEKFLSLVEIVDE